MQRNILHNQSTILSPYCLASYGQCKHNCGLLFWTASQQTSAETSTPACKLHPLPPVAWHELCTQQRHPQHIQLVYNVQSGGAHQLFRLLYPVFICGLPEFHHLPAGLVFFLQLLTICSFTEFQRVFMYQMCACTIWSGYPNSKPTVLT